MSLQDIAQKLPVAFEVLHACVCLYYVPGRGTMPCQYKWALVKPSTICQAGSTGIQLNGRALMASSDCSADGVVFMSSVSLVLDGVLIEPPPPALPLSATVQGSSGTIGSYTGVTGTATGLGALGTHWQPVEWQPNKLWFNTPILCHPVVATVREALFRHEQLLAERCLLLADRLQAKMPYCCQWYCACLTYQPNGAESLCVYGRFAASCCVGGQCRHPGPA